LAERFEVLRVKGFAAVANKPLRLLVQAVGPRGSCQFDRPWGAGEERQGRLVVIGLKGLNRAAGAGPLRAWTWLEVSDASAHDQLNRPRRNRRSGRSRPTAGRHRDPVVC